MTTLKEGVTGPSNPENHPPGTLALLDQEVAQLGQEIDVLTETARRLIARRGELQSGADLTAAVAVLHGTETLAVLVALALVRLAKGGCSCRPTYADSACPTHGVGVRDV